MPVFTTKEEYFYAECLPITIYREGEPFAAVIGDGIPGEPATETDKARAAQIRDALAASEPSVGSLHGPSTAEQVRLALSLAGTEDEAGRQDLRDIIAYLGRRASVQQNALDSLAIVAGEIVFGDGTDASHQRAIDHAVAALKVHGITRDVWALAGEPPKLDPLRDATKDMLAALKKRSGQMEQFHARLSPADRLGGYGVLLKAWMDEDQALIARAEGVADASENKPQPADFEQRRDGWLIAFIPISSAARQWSIDAGPKTRAGNTSAGMPLVAMRLRRDARSKPKASRCARPDAMPLLRPTCTDVEMVAALPRPCPDWAKTIMIRQDRGPGRRGIMPIVSIAYRRTTKEIREGSVEITVDEEVADTLRQGKNMEAWATFTMVGQVNNWRTVPSALQPDLEFVARIDGVEVEAEAPPKPKRRERREIVARALCRRAGHPENTKFQGKPMWMSYLADADAVIAALDSTG